MNEVWRQLVAVAQTASDGPAPRITLTGEGWAVMLVSIGTVLGLVSYCLYRVLTLPPVEMEDIKGPLEIDTRDTEDAD